MSALKLSVRFLPEWSKVNFRWEREITDSDFTEDFRGLDAGTEWECAKVMPYTKLTAAMITGTSSITIFPELLTLPFTGNFHG